MYADRNARKLLALTNHIPCSRETINDEQSLIFKSIHGQSKPLVILLNPQLIAGQHQKVILLLTRQESNRIYPRSYFGLGIISRSFLRDSGGEA